MSPTLPPTQPHGVTPAPVATAWPTVLGVIAIVLGALGALAAVWDILFTTFFDTPETGTMADRFRIPSLTAGLLTAAAAILLLAAGIGLFRRRYWAYRLIWVWAVAKIFIVLISGLLGYLAFDYMTRDQTIPPGGFSIAGFLPLIGVIVGLLWGWALPVFVFFWFGREAVRAEVHTWR